MAITQTHGYNPFRELTLWVAGDPHTNADADQGYDSVGLPISQVEGVEGFDYDLSLFTGDFDSNQEFPTLLSPFKEFGEALVSKFATSKYPPAWRYDILGNHDSGDANTDWADRYIDIGCENTQYSGMKKSERPFPQVFMYDESLGRGLSTHSYYIDLGREIILMISDRNDLPFPYGRGGSSITGGHPSGAITLETWEWTQKVILDNRHRNVLIMTHMAPRNTTAGSPDFDGVTYGLHGSNGIEAGSGSIYTIYDESTGRGESPTDSFLDFLRDNPSHTVIAWMFGHSHLLFNEIVNGRSDRYDIHGCTFLNTGHLTRWHSNAPRLPNDSYSHRMIIKENKLVFTPFLHVATSSYSVGLHEEFSFEIPLKISSTEHNLALSKKLGDLLDDYFNRASLGDDYTLVSTDSIASINNNELDFNKPTSGALGDDYLILNKHHSMINDWYESITYQIKALNTTSNGIGLGVKGSRIDVFRDIVGFFNTKTDSGNYQKLQIIQNQNGVKTTKAVSSSSLVVLVDDVVTMECSILDLDFSVTVTNTRTGLSINVSYSFLLISPNLIQTAYFPAIFITGGSHKINRYIFGSSEYKNTDLCIISDSTGQGVGASSYSSSSQALFILGQTSPHRTVTKCALGSAVTDDLVASLESFKKINAKIYLIRIGSNDKQRNLGGDGELNARVNLAIVVAFLEDLGANVIITTPLARNSDDMADLASGYISDFPNNKVIDSFTFSKDVATFNLNPLWTADGTHLNDFGQQEDYDNITSIAPEML